MEEDDIFLKLRETFYSCRNFEINNLWQKSVLLTAFFVLDFTVYVNIVAKLFDIEMNSQTAVVLHEICSALGIIGIVFSIIWIMMAKGSKAWYELYEAAICGIERDKELKIPEEYIMGEIYSAKPIDNKILTNNAGSYSPSKLNIVVGRILLIIWIVIYFIHLLFEIIWIINAYNSNICPLLHCCISLLSFIMVITIYFTSKLNTWAKSSFLTNQ